MSNQDLENYTKNLDKYNLKGNEEIIFNNLFDNVDEIDFFKNNLNIDETVGTMKKIMIQSSLHQLNDAQLVMKLTDTYLEHIESKIKEMLLLNTQLHNTDTFHVLDGVVRDLKRHCDDIDNIISIAQYNGKYFLINNSSIGYNNTGSLSENDKSLYFFKWNLLYAKTTKFEYCNKMLCPFLMNSINE